MRNQNHNAMMTFPVAPPGAMMSVSFESEEIIRLVDIPEPLAQVLCRYTAGLDGPLFTSLKGKLLCGPSNAQPPCAEISGSIASSS